MKKQQVSNLLQFLVFVDCFQGLQNVAAASPPPSAEWASLWTLCLLWLIEPLRWQRLALDIIPGTFALIALTVSFNNNTEINSSLVFLIKSLGG